LRVAVLRLETKDQGAISIINGNAPIYDEKSYYKVVVGDFNAIVATHYGDINEKLESRDGERYLYQLAKNCHRQTEDIEKFFGINDENGHLLMDRKKALKRWRDYFEEISTVEFPHSAIPSAPTHGPVQKITVEETEAALKKMRPGKATGPDNVAAELWKSKFWYPAEWLAKFFNQVVARKKAPECWRQSTTIPIWKEKDCSADCSNHRPIHLLSHSMKIF
uniref:Endo/exonuclease/phosphatase domain-containing protein n=1 Tax=Heligmosomoides polygyrus TaxID=6339 RepID=A0A183FLY9_HELPZ